MKRKIYLDNNATTPIDPVVLDAMMPYFKEKFGNAASRNHPFGWEAEEAVEKARKTIAKSLNCRAREIVFTSGATESINLAIKGYCERNSEKGKHIITQVIEHKAVLDTCKEMENRGWEVTYLSVNKEGLIDLDNLKETIRDDTVLITIMHANNEIGVMNDIFSIGEICLERDICFLSDAAQSFGKLPIDLEAMHIDMLAVSGHKIYGPKGIGFLYVRQRNPKVELKLQIEGGGHERGMRSGTLPVPLIVGLGEASRLCFENMDAESKRLQSMRDKLVAMLTDELPDTIINGSMKQRLPHNVNFSFPHVEGEALLMKLESIACSSGSACTSATLKPSYVMKALGHSEELAHSSIRIAFGRMNKEDDTEIAAKEIIDAVMTLREKSPFHPTAKSQPA